MDMIRILPAAPASPGDEPLLAPLDWDGLRARFLAARQLRQALSPAGVACAASFDPAAAAAIASICTAPDHPSPPVNPSALGNGKEEAGKSRVVAAARTAGERG
jgi:hypothetical protein